MTLCAIQEAKQDKKASFELKKSFEMQPWKSTFGNNSATVGAADSFQWLGDRASGRASFVTVVAPVAGPGERRCMAKTPLSG